MFVLAGCGSGFDCGKDCFLEGAFSIAVVDRDGPSERVLVTKDGVELFASPVGASWALVGEGDATVGYASGSFDFEDDPVSSCTALSTGSIARTESGVQVVGTFMDCASEVTLTFAQDDDRLGFTLESGDSNHNRVSLVLASSETERLVGFGEQYDRIDMKGSRLPIWCQEQGHGRGLDPVSGLFSITEGNSAGDWHTSYSCVPWMMSSKKRGLYLTNTEYSVFDMTAMDRIEITAWSSSLSGAMVAGENPAALLEAFSSYTGTMAPLPMWTDNGVIVRVHGGSQEVRDAVAELVEADVPVSAVWVEDWCGLRRTAFGNRIWWNWDVDRGQYPDWETLVSDLEAEGVRTLAYVNPFLVDASDKPELGRHLYAEAEEAGYLVQHPDGGPYWIEMGGFYAAMVDLSNPLAVAWMKDALGDVVDTGVAGWMADFAEALPVDAVLHSGQDAAAYHNQYPVQWARLNAEMTEERGVTSEFLNWHRSGGALSPGVARAFWTGDQLVTWDAFDGLATVVPALNSGGLSGWSINHSDTGGYLSIELLDVVRDRELFQRWLELNAFTPLIRMHSTNAPDANHQYNTDPETLAHLSDMAALYLALAPYRRVLMNEARASGMPLVRHPLLHFPDDPEVWSLTTQFMLGPDVMVVPVVEPGASRVSAYLPSGDWVHLWSGTEYPEPSGAWYDVEAPVGQPAVFYSEGSEVGVTLKSAKDAL